MEAKLRRIGNSLGIIIPKDFLQAISLKEGDKVKLTIKRKRINLVLERKKEGY